VASVIPPGQASAKKSVEQKTLHRLAASAALPPQQPFPRLWNREPFCQSREVAAQSLVQAVRLRALPACPHPLRPRSITARRLRRVPAEDAVGGLPLDPCCACGSAISHARSKSRLAPRRDPHGSHSSGKCQLPDARPSKRLAAWARLVSVESRRRRLRAGPAAARRALFEILAHGVAASGAGAARESRPAVDASATGAGAGSYPPPLPPLMMG